MAPAKPGGVEHLIERTPEYGEFIASLKAFHEARGTQFDAEPKMGNINVDLLKLFNHILQNGGYDKVSEEKLKWRQMCDELGLSRTNAPADAYALKQIFYKNLAAYEIKTVHKKEPPPPEILEFVTAKGGSLLTRTLENFTGRGKQPGAPESPRSIDDGTPARERKADEMPGSGRASRGLREAPPQRIPFTPDTNPSRATRHVSGQQHTNNSATTSHPQAQSQTHPLSHGHQPMSVPQAQQTQAALRGSSHAYNPPNLEHQNPHVHNFQPPQIQGIQLQEVVTPGSKPEAFNRKRGLSQQSSAEPTPAMMLRQHLHPSYLEGPNIYERCLLALRSNIRAEQAFALNHLVKISFERGDKYKFMQFPGLAEGLTEKVLEVGSLFYHVEWTISYVEPVKGARVIGHLDGNRGTYDILERIAQLKPKVVLDSVQPPEFRDQMTLIKEAMLTIRNMVTLADNAHVMASFPTLKDLLCILLNLPYSILTVELRNYALEVAECVTQFFTSDVNDPLYRSLLSQLVSMVTSIDRGLIKSTLRAINRIAMDDATEVNKLDGVPQIVLQSIDRWLLVNDSELTDACLDFLYQYTAVVSNLDSLVATTRMEDLVVQLVRLLSHGGRKIYTYHVLNPESVAPAPPPEEIATVPTDLLEYLMGTEEPDRCQAWIRCLFEEDAQLHVTQIAIWQAYTGAFFHPLRKIGRTMISAADFIRNISHVYKGASAQIVHEGPHGEIQRFIIKGIRPRWAPVHDGHEYLRCQWRLARAHGQPADQPQPPCGAWLATPQKMWEHVLRDHLGETLFEPSPGAALSVRACEKPFTCEWDHCTKYSTPTNLALYALMAHVKIHIHNLQRARRQGHAASASGDAGSSGLADINATKPRIFKPAEVLTFRHEVTTTVRDERNPNAPAQAGGIPLSAILVLRNIARNIGKTKADEALRIKQANGGEPGGWCERLFRSYLPRLHEVVVENEALGPHAASLIIQIEEGLE